MKINGQVIDNSKTEILVIPKGGVDIVFEAKPVLNYDDFDKLCPEPLAPSLDRPGQSTVLDVTDKKYLAEIDKWAKYKASWTIITSLSATSGLEWDTVELNNPETWSNWEQELRIVFAEAEIKMILDIVWLACGLNQSKIDEATANFIASLAKTPEQL